jgi:hypothetical protein
MIQKVESDENDQDDQVFFLLIVKGVLNLDCYHCLDGKSTQVLHICNNRAITQKTNIL